MATPLSLVGQALVGHDHGANLGWKLCLLHPNVFTAYAAMSVPYGGRPKAAPLSGLRAKFGHETDRDAAFNYQLHHCLPSAAAQYDASPHAALLAIYSDPGPKVTLTLTVIPASALTLPLALPLPLPLPLTLTEGGWRVVRRATGAILRAVRGGHRRADVPLGLGSGLGSWLGLGIAEPMWSRLTLTLTQPTLTPDT